MREISSLIEECERIKEVRSELFEGCSLEDGVLPLPIRALDARLGAIIGLFRTEPIFSVFRGYTYNMIMLYLVKKKNMVVAGRLVLETAQWADLDSEFNKIYFDDDAMVTVIRATFDNYYMGGVGLSA